MRGGLALAGTRQRLFERWWGPVEKELPTQAAADNPQRRLPLEDSAPARAFRQAVRRYGDGRVARAWAD